MGLARVVLVCCLWMTLGSSGPSGRHGMIRPIRLPVATIVSLAALLLLAGCSSASPASSESTDVSDEPQAPQAQSVDVAYQLQQEFPLTIQVTSTSIKHTGYLLKDFTCEGGNLSPQLTWTGVPPETKSIAVVVDDIDAEEGALAHWVLWGLPADKGELGGGASGSESLPVGAGEGTNGYGGTGWKGPCPPPRVITNFANRYRSTFARR